MTELQRLKGLLPPEMQSWVFVEVAAATDPPLITIEEIGRDEVEIQVDLETWEALALDQRNLLFWHEVGRIQNDAVPRDGWEMAALAIGLGGAIGELWVQDGLLLLLALGLSSFAGYRLYLKNNPEKHLQEAIAADERAIALATRFGYSPPQCLPQPGERLESFGCPKPARSASAASMKNRLDALRRSASKAQAQMARSEGSPEAMSSENGLWLKWWLAPWLHPGSNRWTLPPWPKWRQRLVMTAGPWRLC